MANILVRSIPAGLMHRIGAAAAAELGGLGVSEERLCRALLREGMELWSGGWRPRGGVGAADVVAGTPASKSIRKLDDALYQSIQQAAEAYAAERGEERVFVNDMLLMLLTAALDQREGKIARRSRGRSGGSRLALRQVPA